MKGLYHVLKTYERDLLDLRDKFYLGQNIGFGSIPVHHHWDSTSMPFTALPVRRNDSGVLEVNSIFHWFPEWYALDGSVKAIGPTKGTIIVRPVLSDADKGYFVSSYMFKGFADSELAKLEKSGELYEYSQRYVRERFWDRDEIYPLHPAFVRMPREVFRGGLALMLGTVVSETGVPRELRHVFTHIPHAEWDEALTFSLYIGEEQNVRSFLVYWENILDRYFATMYKPKFDEMDEIIQNLENDPEWIVSTKNKMRFERFGNDDNHSQWNMLMNIKQRKMFIERVLH